MTDHHASHANIIGAVLEIEYVAMDAISPRVWRFGTLIGILAVSYAAFWVVLEARHALVATFIVLLVLAWISKGVGTKIPQDKDGGTEGLDVGNWDPNNNRRG